MSLKLALDMWPEDFDSGQHKGSDFDELEESSKEDEKLSLEEQVAREVSAIKQPRRKGRFGMVVFQVLKVPILIVVHKKSIVRRTLSAVCTTFRMQRSYL